MNLSVACAGLVGNQKNPSSSRGPAEILEEIIQDERARSDFDPREPRVSAIGYCQRKQVARAHGIFMDYFPWYYGEMGHALQHRAFLRFKRRYVDAEEEVSVPHAVGTCHPDIYLPTERLAIQVKTGSDNKANRANFDAANREQCLLEWASWRGAGHAITQDGRRIEGVPETYWLLLLGRESAGRVMGQSRVKWDPIRAARLQARLLETHAYIESETLPPVPSPMPTQECQGFGTGILCPMYEHCHGK